MSGKSLALALAALAFALPALAADSFASLIDSYKHLRLPPDAAAVNNISFTIGHVTLDLRSGTAAYVRAGDETAGIFFKGKGALRYETAEATELPIVSYNVRKASHQKYEGDASKGAITGTFDELLLLGTNVPLPVLTGGGAAALTDDFARHMERFGRSRDVPPAHAIVLHKLAFPQKKFVEAQLGGDGDDLVYRYDEGEDSDESLLKLQTPDVPDATMKRWLLPVVLSRQPIGRDHRAVRPSRYTLTAIDFTLIGDGDDAKLTMTESITRGAGQNAIHFSQNDLEIVKMGIAPRRYVVNSVKDASGRALPFDHDKLSLLVGLEGVSGESIKLTFDISGDFLARTGGDSAWQLGTDAWFPQPDLGGQSYTVHSMVRVRKPFVPFAPGRTIRRSEEGDYNVVENVIDTPVQFEVVHAGKYETFEDKRGDITIRVASYAGRNDRAAKQLTNLAYSILDYYQYFLGPMPFPELNIIQVNTFGYGQAPPGTLFITNEAFNSMIGDANRFFSEGINERFAHEIAHYYWGHVIKMPSAEEQWLTESFAEYSAALALKKYQGKAVYDRLVAKWKLRAHDATEIAPIAYANRVSGDPMIAFQTRFGLLYAKGPYLLYTLHKELGDDQFLTFMKSYQKSRRWKFSSTAETASLLTFLTKKDYAPFFEKYFWGTAMPE